MLEPAVTEEAIPVLADPDPDRMIAQVLAFLLAQDPLEALRLFLPTSLQAHRMLGRDSSQIDVQGSIETSWEGNGSGSNQVPGGFALFDPRTEARHAAHHHTTYIISRNPR